MKLCILFTWSCLLLLLYYGPINGQIALEEDFNNMRIQCHPIFTCVGYRSGTKPCSCSESCSIYGTCCPPFNAREQKNPVKASCKRRMSSNPSDADLFYFMVDRCPNGDSRASVWENLCKDDRQAQHDVMKLVPVTSLLTSITYKNYFCFRCHETTENFVYWNVKLEDIPYRRMRKIPEIYNRLRYRSQDGTWRARNAISYSWSIVNWEVYIPQEISPLVVQCIPDLISKCSDNWRDNPWSGYSVSSKCRSYEYVTHIWRNFRSLKYRNPHCAICNFENLYQSTCEELFAVGGYQDLYDLEDSYYPGGVAGLTSGVKKVLFSFTDMLDIDFSDGEKVGKVIKPNCDEKYWWDPFWGICRKLTCIFPGDVVIGGKCVPK